MSSFTKSEIYVYKNGHRLARLLAFCHVFSPNLKHHLLLHKFSGSHRSLKIPCTILTHKA